MYQNFILLIKFLLSKGKYDEECIRREFRYNYFFGFYHFLSEISLKIKIFNKNKFKPIIKYTLI